MAGRPAYVYTPEKLEQMLVLFNARRPLPQLEAVVNTSSNGIVQKLTVLSMDDPDTWNPDIVKDYVHDFNVENLEKNREQIRERGRIYYRNNRGKKKEREKRYFENLSPEQKARYKITKTRHYRDNIDKIRKVHKDIRVRYKGKWKFFGDFLEPIVVAYENNWVLSHYSIRGARFAFARETGIHNSLLSKYLAGDRKPTDEFLKKLSVKSNIPLPLLKQKAEGRYWLARVNYLKS